MATTIIAKLRIQIGLNIVILFKNNPSLPTIPKYMFNVLVMARYSTFELVTLFSIELQHGVKDGRQTHPWDTIWSW